VGLWAHQEGRVHRGHQVATLCRAVQRLEDLHRGALSVALQEDLWGDRHQVPLHRGDRGEGHQVGLWGDPQDQEDLQGDHRGHFQADLWVDLRDLHRGDLLADLQEDQHQAGLEVGHQGDRVGVHRGVLRVLLQGGLWVDLQMVRHCRLSLGRLVDLWGDRRYQLSLDQDRREGREVGRPWGDLHGELLRAGLWVEGLVEERLLRWVDLRGRLRVGLMVGLLVVHLWEVRQVVHLAVHRAVVHEELKMVHLHRPWVDREEAVHVVVGDLMCSSLSVDELTKVNRESSSD